MMKTRKNKIILGLALVFLLGAVGPVSGQATKTFTGKISEIAKGSELDLNKRDVFYIVKLEEYPKIKFRLIPEDAVKFGVIEKSGPTGVVTPKMSKGMGWKVKLTCNSTNFGDLQAPVYKVTSLERLDN
jgi:hypothetical protein